MPKEFRFYVGDDLTFRCTLNSTQCTGHAKSGLRCKRKCIIGFEYCFSHLASELRLKIKDSTVPEAGKGLFVSDKTKEPDEIVFRPGDTICEYKGQLIDNDTRIERYGNHTAPYAVQMNANQSINSACKRGVGSLGNTNTGRNNSSFSIDTRNKKVKVKATRNIRNNQEIFIAYGHSYRFDEDTHHATVASRSK